MQYIACKRKRERERERGSIRYFDMCAALFSERNFTCAASDGKPLLQTLLYNIQLATRCITHIHGLVVVHTIVIAPFNCTGKLVLRALFVYLDYIYRYM